MWDAILHGEWVKGRCSDEIIHKWAEDGSCSVFTVPCQLRDQIVEMQNWLSMKQQKIDCADNDLRRARGFFED